MAFFARFGLCPFEGGTLELSGVFGGTGDVPIAVENGEVGVTEL